MDMDVVIIVPGSRVPADQSLDQGDDEQYQKNEKQDFRDPGSCRGYPAETEDRGNNSNDKKYNRPVKHVVPPLGYG